MNSAATTATSSVDAAALQAEMAKKYGIAIPGKGGRGSRRSAQNPKVSKSDQTGVVGVVCPSCTHTTVDTAESGRSEVCSFCGYFLPMSNPTTASPPTLAQRRGLLLLPYGQSVLIAPKAVVAMTPLEWYALEGHLQRMVNPDCSCPICMDKFINCEEVLLSCGHIFHKTCLRSFENFMKSGDLACPMCR
jgi:hypothetical protein